MHTHAYKIPSPWAPVGAKRISMPFLLQCSYSPPLCVARFYCPSRGTKLSLCYLPIAYAWALSSVSLPLKWLSHCILPGPALLFPLQVLSRWQLRELPMCCTIFTLSVKLSHMLSALLPLFPTLFAPVSPSLHSGRGGHIQARKTDGFTPLSQDKFMSDKWS